MTDIEHLAEGGRTETHLRLKAIKDGLQDEAIMEEVAGIDPYRRGIIRDYIIKYLTIVTGDRHE